MTENDIRKLYTQKVSELLAQGFEIYPDTMSGSQGEIAHIDLFKDGELLRVLLDNGYQDYEHDYGNIYILTVGRFTEPLTEHGRTTIWNNRLEPRFQIELVKISDTFYTTREEGRRMAEKRHERYKVRRVSPDTELGDAYKSIILRWLHKQPGMKTCKASDITRIRRQHTRDGRIRYDIWARNKTFVLMP